MQLMSRSRSSSGFVVAAFLPMFVLKGMFMEVNKNRARARGHPETTNLGGVAMPKKRGKCRMRDGPSSSQLTLRFYQVWKKPNSNKACSQAAANKYRQGCRDRVASDHHHNSQAAANANYAFTGCSVNFNGPVTIGQDIQIDNSRNDKFTGSKETKKASELVSSSPTKKVGSQENTSKHWQVLVFWTNLMINARLFEKVNFEALLQAIALIAWSF